MEIRIIRDKSKKVDEETAKSGIIWATLASEATKDAWNLTDDEIRAVVKTRDIDTISYEDSHDDLGNPVDAVMVRLGKGGYSVHTVFDNPLDAPVESVVD